MKLLSCFGALVLLSLSAAESSVEAVEEVEVCVDGSTAAQCSDKPMRARSDSLVRNQPSSSGQRVEAVGVKFKNPRKYQVHIWWLPPHNAEPVFQGVVGAKSVTATIAYLRHTFAFSRRGDDPSSEFHRITVTKGQNLYLLPCPGSEEPNDNADSECANRKFYKDALAELEFMDRYLAEKGYPWLAHFPRAPPILHIWSADEIGQRHTVRSKQTYWVCPGSDGLMTSEETAKRCRATNPFEIRSAVSDDTPEVAADAEIELTLEVVETHPKVFVIKNVISDVEADIIIELAKPRIRRSLAGTGIHGGLVSDTRTSHQTWLKRTGHPVVDTLYRRAADILNVSEARLWPGKNVEQLQVLNYKVGQEYNAHHDFGANNRPAQRIMTLLLYLNERPDEDSGGETSFPKAKHGFVKARPGKGNGVLFYSMLEDGNADDLSLHAAMPVSRGEKWVCNFWVWDPHM